MTRAGTKTKNRKAVKQTANIAPRSPARVVRRYDAAKIDRLTADWVFGPLSANEEIKGGLEVVRNRARDGERNNDHVRRYLAMVEANIVGRGFQLRIEGDDDGAIRDKFLAWADQSEVTGRLSWGDQQRLVARVTARDGEKIARLLEGPDYKDGLAIQYLEADYLDLKKSDQTTRNGNRVIMGVELDPRGKAVAYHLLTAHPGDTYGAQVGIKTDRIEAEKIVHVYFLERPGQVRGVSWMSSALMSLRMLQGYQEAELVAARIASCKMGFYVSQPGEDYKADGKDSATGAPLSDAAPGVFEQLPNGWDFKQFDPNHPSGNYGPFVKAILRQLAGGLNVAYNNFANDLDNVSYSSIRSGTIEEREAWIVKQEWFARAFLRPVFKAWLRMASLVGTITIDEAERFAGKDIWTGRRWPWVDPEADIKSKKEEISLGLAAPSDIAAERGDDFNAIQGRIRKDNDARVSNGLPPVAATQPTTKPQAG